MGRKALFRGKVYKPTKFGEGLQPGTVEWELNRRRQRAEERELQEIQKSRPVIEREPRSEFPETPTFFLFRLIESAVRVFRRK
jgi:hypothetical protein